MPDQNNTVSATPTTPAANTEPTIVAPSAMPATDSSAPTPIATDPIASSPTINVPVTPIVLNAEDVAKDDEATKVEVLTGEPTNPDTAASLVSNAMPATPPVTPAAASAPTLIDDTAMLSLPAEQAGNQNSDAPSVLSQAPVVSPVVASDTAVTPIESPATPSTSATLPTPQTSPVPMSTAPTTAMPKPELPLNDIYPTPQPANAPMPQVPSAGMPMPETPKEHESVLGVIGEVIGVIGLTTLLVMIISPFYKVVIPQTSWDAIKLIGWLTTTSCLFVGFVFTLFSPRKITLKALLFIGLLISALLFLGVNGSASITDKLDVYLGQYLAYFR